VKTIEQKIMTLSERVARLRDLSSRMKSLSDYQRSADTQDIVERNLQIAIEACIDIGKIIISAKELPVPQDNKNIFVTLAKAGMLSAKSLEFMVPMAGTRNILVHGYDKVDDSLIYGILKRHLKDFDLFVVEVRDNYLAKA
jgi:uncharacterized protein YutE (UPF0331/DUF86 family)